LDHEASRIKSEIIGLSTSLFTKRKQLVESRQRLETELDRITRATTKSSSATLTRVGLQDNLNYVQGLQHRASGYRQQCNDIEKSIASIQEDINTASEALAKINKKIQVLEEDEKKWLKKEQHRLENIRDEELIDIASAKHAKQK